MNRALRRSTWLALALAGLALLFGLCLSLGSVSVPFERTVSILYRALTGQPQHRDTAVDIVLALRLPRVSLAALVGAALALAGASMQGLLRNPLADGGTLGLSSGAALGAVLALVFFGGARWLNLGAMAVSAVAFSFLSLMIIYSLAFALDQGVGTHTIILVGIVFGMFVSALLSLIIAFSGNRVQSITFWMMGSLASANWRKIALVAVSLAIAGLFLLPRAETFNAFALGDEAAQHLGVNVRHHKWVILLAVCLLVGVSVAVSGGIAFVGLVVPHLSRLLVGANHKRLLPVSLAMGAAFLMLADLFARVVVSPLELPIGVVTSFIGAFFFLVFMFSRRQAVKR